MSSRQQSENFMYHRMKSYDDVLIQTVMKYKRRCNLLFIATALLK